MTSIPMYHTLFVAVLAAAVAYATTPLAGRLARGIGMLDRPSGRKIHGRIVPYLGGLGILAGWCVAFLRPDTARESIVLLVGMAVLFVTGFVDDRFDISANLRLLIQVGVAVGVTSTGIQVELFAKLGLPGAFAIDPAITIIWIVGITNAFNFMDNMDGAAAGVGGIAAASFGVLGVMFGQQLVSMMGFALAGACFGFLRHNFHPARIFMGDTGSLPLGFALAILGVKVEFPEVHPVVAFAIPVIVLGLFIIDTGVMAVGRITRGEPLVGARLDHIAHRLLGKQMSVPHVAVLFYVLGAGCGFAGIVMSQAPAYAAFAAIALASMIALRFGSGMLSLSPTPVLLAEVGAKQQDLANR